MSDRPVIDLSGGKYDAFETMLSQKIGLKVILVRGWELPDSYSMARANIAFANGDPDKWDKAKKEFAQVEANTLAQLRDNIADRDAAVGHDLTENDLRSLVQAGHVTLRFGNSEPEQAVLVIDPGQSGRTPLERLLPVSFSNAWWNGARGESQLDAKPFVENFDIAPEDLRNYMGLQNARYALMNQDEFNTKDKGWYYQPFYYDFARLSDKSPGMWKEAFQLPFDVVTRKFELDGPWAPEEMGIKDKDFFEKLKLLSAVKALGYNILKTMSFETFARLGYTGQEGAVAAVTGQIKLREDLEKQLYKHKPKEQFGGDNELGDFRSLFPLFREMYEADKSEGPQRAYYDTIMQGLQKYFPTLTNAPVPAMGRGTQEPPRTLVKAGPAPAATPQPGPAPA